MCFTIEMSTKASNLKSFLTDAAFSVSSDYVAHVSLRNRQPSDVDVAKDESTGRSKVTPLVSGAQRGTGISVMFREGISQGGADATGGLN